MAKTHKKYKRKKESDKIEISNRNDRNEIEATILSAKRKYGQSPRKERTPEEKREYLKLMLYLLGWIILLSAIYMTCVQVGFQYIMLIYTVLGGALFIVWLVFNGGFKKIDIDKYEKPEEMGYDEFHRLRNKLKQRQKKSKYYLILFIPFPLIMLMDYIIIVWGDKLAR